MLSAVTYAAGTPASSALQHGLRQLGLRREGDVVGDPGGATAVAIVGPAGGEVQGPVQEGVPARPGVGEEDPDLRVRRAPRRAAVLRLHARRLVALLQEPGLVDHQHALRVAQVLHHVGAQVVAHRVRVPRRAIEELLEAIRRRVARRLGELPAVLALDTAQQPAQVGRRMPPRLRPREPRPDPPHRRREVLVPCRRHRHAAPFAHSRGTILT